MGALDVGHGVMLAQVTIRFVVFLGWVVFANSWTKFRRRDTARRVDHSDAEGLRHFECGVLHRRCGSFGVNSEN